MSLTPPPPSYSLRNAPRRREDEPPPPPPGFELDGAPAGRADDTQPSPPDGFTLDHLTGDVVDGDTLRMENGGNLRVYGIDAPESKQQGWDRNGQAVPIGQIARDALAEITTPNAIPGPQHGSSYGRPVASVTDNGLDLGEQQIRTGNALAAPSFMTDSPTERVRYMQAERLARLNRQGLHQTFAQTPYDFRHDPMPAPDRETVAQFWDTPTPWAGMRPEDEAKYVGLLQTSNDADEIVAFARGAGATIDPTDVHKWFKDRAEYRAKAGRDLPAYANYQERPPVMTDQGDGAAGAGARGLANGVLPNFLEETGAVVDTLGGTNNRENVWNSDSRLADIYANNAAQNEAITRFDRFEHPYVTTSAEIAGGLALPMGRVTTAADLAKFGAGYGALSGLGREGTIPERLTSGVVGAGEGLALTVGGVKALEAAAPYVGKGLRYAGEKAGILRPPPRIPDRIDVGGSPTAEPQFRIGPDGRSYAVDPAAAPANRIPDRIDVGQGSGGMTPPPRRPIDTAYPGPVPGKAPSLDDIKPQIEEWARQQGIGGDVMLHGSKSANIDAFDPYSHSGYGLFGAGTYLTDHAGVALGYTGKGLKGAADQSGRTIYSVEQSVKNPLDMDAPANRDTWEATARKVLGDWSDEPFFSGVPEGASNERFWKDVEEHLSVEGVTASEGRETMDALVRSLGHDGLTHIGGGRRGNADAPEHRVVIALDPEQTVIRNQLPVGDMLRPPMRDRNWIDVGQVPAPRVPDRIDVGGQGVPPPPPGYRLDNPRSIDMMGDRGPSISQEMPPHPAGEVPGQPYPISQPMSAEQMAAAARDIRPGDVLPIPSNMVGSAEELAAAQAGRYGPAKPVNEATALESRTIAAQNGRQLPKRGPSDLVTWLRTQGGIKDQGGNLRAMGIDNAPRDLDFARGEQRFGKLIDNDAGMNLDDAARKAWEAGYLPGLDRPDINTFLDAIDRTHSGAERFFHPDDLPEVAKFEGMRTDRQQLEEQLAQGPVHVDRSAPADEPQPFPPPQAYEEWPAGGPDFAGNINLNKLHTPQDIKRALSTVNNHVGFDAATRGRVTQAETERLAGELGMTPESLLSRRRGQAFNAEEAHAARQILAKSGNELVNIAKRVGSMENPGDDVLAQFSQALRRHAAIQEQVAGMTAEAGRTLGQFRMIADSKAVNGEVLARLVDMNGGRGRLQDAAQTLLEAVEQGPGKFNVEAERLAKPRWIDKALELRYNMMLSGPQTHAANVISNTLTSISQFPEYAVASGIGLGRRAFRGAPRTTDRVYPSEMASRAFGLLQGVKSGMRQFVRTLRTGETSDLVTKVESQAQEAISGLKGKIIRTPSRALSAEDELFKAMARNMELYGLADRAASAQGLRGEAKAKRIAELVANPSDEMLTQAFDYARYVTFQRPLNGIPQSISAFTNKHPVAKLVIPFVRTPTNLLKFAAERSPAAPLIKEWRADFMAGGARRDLAIAKATVGSGLAFWVADLAQQGLITGSSPSDKNKSNLMRADGWQPYSVRVGDKWMSYNRLDPFAITMGTAADLATKRDTMSPRQLEEASGLLVASIIKNMGDKTWLSGLSDMFGMLGDPQRNLGNYASSQAASLAVPAIVSQTANAIDPTRRESDGVAETVQSRLPGLKSSLPPQRNLFGEPITTDRLGPDLVSPVTQSTNRHDPVAEEMLRLGASATEFPKGRKVDGKWVNYTPQEYDQLQAKAGRAAHGAIAGMIAQPNWKSLPPEEQRQAIADAIKDARGNSRAEAGTNAPSAPPRLPGAPPSKLPNAPRKGVLSPPPRGFAVDGEAGGINVYADLLKVIPGLTPGNLTSGYRTPAYQEDMKRRGYHPADNSGHLDGSSFDIVPPRGRSIAWLAEQVRRYNPKAHLLPEGDHLHTTFPGYYGAPVLGGAKRAGLRNPNMGMPAPPPGFKLD